MVVNCKKKKKVLKNYIGIQNCLNLPRSNQRNKALVVLGFWILSVAILGCSKKNQVNGLHSTATDTTKTAFVVGVSPDSMATENVEDPDLATWIVEIEGELDGERLHCQANAVRELSDIGANCWAWRLVDKDCQGNEVVDWLHDGTDSGKVCNKDGEWVFDDFLPGRSYCIPTIVGQKEDIKKVTLDCTWECQSSSYPCAGSAVYHFVKK